jgi:hypothetical protein
MLGCDKRDIPDTVIGRLLEPGHCVGVAAVLVLVHAFESQLTRTNMHACTHGLELISKGLTQRPGTCRT